MPLQAKDLMSCSLFTVSPEMSLIEMDRALSELKISGAPVVKDGRLVGIVSSTDIGQAFSSNLKTNIGESSYYWHSNGTLTSLLVGADEDDSVLAEKIRRCTVGDIMTADVISVTPETEISEVAALMVKYKIHRVLVVEEKRPVGIITSLDMVGLHCPAS